MTDFENKGLGCIPSEPDPRDYHFPSGTDGKGSYPKSHNSLDGMAFVIKDQGSVQSCVGFATSVAIEIAYWKQTGKKLTRSPGFIYGNRPPDVTNYTGDGYYPRDALKGAQKYGVVVQEDFNYNIEVPTVIKKVADHKNTLYPKAKLVKIKNYYDLMNPNPDAPPSGFERLNEDAVKSAIMKYGSVVASTLVFDNWYRVSKYSPVLKIPDFNTEKLYGGHCIVIVGWTAENNWIIANSWGNTYADKGFVYAPKAYPFTEAWTFDGLLLGGEEEPMKPASKDGWYKQNGKWRYRKNGKDVIGWIKVQNIWYYVGGDGYMVTGWIKEKGDWYYLNPNGSMRIGWLKLDGRWYWFGVDGKAAKGFQTIDGKRYYFAEKWIEGVKECQLIVTDQSGAIK